MTVQDVRGKAFQAVVVGASCELGDLNGAELFDRSELVPTDPIQRRVWLELEASPAGRRVLGVEPMYVALCDALLGEGHPAAERFPEILTSLDFAALGTYKVPANIDAIFDRFVNGPDLCAVKREALKTIYSDVEQKFKAELLTQTDSLQGARALYLRSMESSAIHDLFITPEIPDKVSAVVFDSILSANAGWQMSDYGKDYTVYVAIHDALQDAFGPTNHRFLKNQNKDDGGDPKAQLDEDTPFSLLTVRSRIFKEVEIHTVEPINRVAHRVAGSEAEELAEEPKRAGNVASPS